jgi:hypothetical protein
VKTLSKVCIAARGRLWRPDPSIHSVFLKRLDENEAKLVVNSKREELLKSRWFPSKNTDVFNCCEKCKKSAEKKNAENVLLNFNNSAFRFSEPKQNKVRNTVGSINRKSVLTGKNDVPFEKEAREQI